MISVNIAILIGVSLLVCLSIIAFVYKQTKYVKLSEVKQYVEANSEYLTELANQLMAEQKTEVEIYRHRSELPPGCNIDKLYSDLKIANIFVAHNRPDINDPVSISFKEKKGNFICGIYYSPNDVIVSEGGTPKEGDKYEYNDEYNDRHIYRSEKICDYWYYYEDDTWN